MSKLAATVLFLEASEIFVPSFVVFAKVNKLIFHQLIMHHFHNTGDVSNKLVKQVA